jgi:hypothetical protein
MARHEFDFPSLEGLKEGEDYRILEWSEAKEFISEFAQECPEGEKMVFGVCRKGGKSGDGEKEKDFDSSKKTKQEESIEAEAKKQKSDVKSNKPFTINGEKFGWAMKGGRPVVVEWGSVAGEKKVGPKKSGSKKGGKPKKDTDREVVEAQIRGKRKALDKQTSEAGRNAILEQIEDLEAKL